MRLRENRCEGYSFYSLSNPLFYRIGEDKVPDFVESSLVQELECVKLWQRRIQAAIEQVG